MELGIIGLGKMGGNLALQFIDKGVHVVGKKRSPKPELTEKGVKVVKDYDEFVRSLKPLRMIYLSLPVGSIIDKVLKELVPHLDKGDVIMDGGNSYYKDSIARAHMICHSNKGEIQVSYVQIFVKVHLKITVSRAQFSRHLASSSVGGAR